MGLKSNSKRKGYYTDKGTILHLTNLDYGFIKTKQEEVLYFHRNDIGVVIFSHLREGQEVEFEIGRGLSGKKQVQRLRIIRHTPQREAVRPLFTKELTGFVKVETVHIICPACGQQVEATSSDGRVKGYCAVAKEYINILASEWKDPEYRPKQGDATKRLWKDPEYRARMRAIAKKKWQDPEYRAKQMAGSKKSREATGYRDKLSAASKKLWQDPEYRARVSAARKKLQQDPGYQARQSAASKKLWQDPEYRAKQIAIRKNRGAGTNTKTTGSGA